MGDFSTTMTPVVGSPFLFDNMRMNVTAEKVSEVLFPERLRPYVTFRLMTVLVAVLAIWNIAFSMFMKPQWPRLDGQIRTFHQALHSTYFLVPYNIGVAIGFWVVFATREKAEYYQLRVLCYGMLLGGVVGEALSLLL
jgi:hypothetical protein